MSLMALPPLALLTISSLKRLVWRSNCTKSSMVSTPVTSSTSLSVLRSLAIWLIKLSILANSKKKSSRLTKNYLNYIRRLTSTSPSAPVLPLKTCLMLALLVSRILTSTSLAKLLYFLLYNAASPHSSLIAPSPIVSTRALITSLSHSRSASRRWSAATRLPRALCSLSIPKVVLRMLSWSTPSLVSVKTSSKAKLHLMNSMSSSRLALSSTSTWAPRISRWFMMTRISSHQSKTFR